MIVTINSRVAGIELFGDVMIFGKDGMNLLADVYVPNALQQVEGSLAAIDVQQAITSSMNELEAGSRCLGIVKHNGGLVYAHAV